MLAGMVTFGEEATKEKEVADHGGRRVEETKGVPLPQQ
jgi:hypothetical protein